ncbi:response regulator transcription factor [Macrococcus hajekii]|uniref:Response regulator transcription factor n=1 Tax=Macrococcus hajekii TaxID=198482 RepID=A0A4V3BE64_9STAP|nr:response regulator transcription factor [Macrococcus hajekii]TDM01724.1 response regulator transcription factor [Macrococcus hajekii]GGB06874.1 DNA-binding response regulator [Macrococcus hajekii]
MNILIIEDDPVIARALKDELSRWQFNPLIIQDFNHILEEFEAFHPHLILMDINLPSFNGYHWCQQIRLTSNVPIIFISSRTDSMDQVMAMQMGADDFIEKPFNMSVTISKIQALLRRTYDFVQTKNELEVDGCKLAVDEARVYYDGQHATLTHTELQILAMLFKHKGQFVSRNALIEKCWESEHFIDDNTLAVNMTRLRKKLLSLGLDQFITTKKNIGYAVAL